MESWGKHSKNPRMGDWGVAKLLTHVECWHVPLGHLFLHPTIENQGQKESRCPEIQDHIKAQFSPSSSQFSLCSWLQPVPALRYSGSHLESAYGLHITFGMWLLRSHGYGERTRECMGQVQVMSSEVKELLCSPGFILAWVWGGRCAFLKESVSLLCFHGPLIRLPRR